MSLAVLDQNRRLDSVFEDESGRVLANARHSHQKAGRDRLTLDDLIIGVWEGLATRTVVCCPVCGGAMASRPTARAERQEGDCADCGARLY